VTVGDGIKAVLMDTVVTVGGGVIDFPVRSRVYTNSMFIL